MSNPQPVVRTSAGRVSGELVDGVLRFLGVPYAAPPLGQLRLQPPSPAEPWAEVRSATAFAEPPRQRTLGPAGRLIGQEDCLHLNVWTPGTEGAGRPVLLWIYGGGFEGGSTSEPRLDGAAFARLADVVVITAAYRVGALGWAHLSDRGGRWERSSNVGLQDQAAALEWVAENVASFGGDPDSITVAGESAGAFSIAALLALPQAARRIARAALFSGSTARVFPADAGRELTDRLLAAVGAPDRPEALLELPVDAIVAAQGEVIDRDIGRRNAPGGRSWGIVHDGVVLAETPEQALAAGRAAGIPLLLGSTEDEVSLFRAVVPGFDPPDLAAVVAEMGGRVPPENAARLVADYVALLGSEDPGRVRDRLLTDVIYRLPSAGMADVAASAGGTAFVYRFGCRYSEALGAFHTSDVRFLLGTLDQPDTLFPLGDDPQLRALGAEMSLWFARFVRTGDPGWPAWRRPERTALRADRTSREVADPDAAPRDIWARATSTPAAGSVSRTVAGR